MRQEIVQYSEHKWTKDDQDQDPLVQLEHDAKEVAFDEIRDI